MDNGSCERAGTVSSCVKDLLEEQYIEIQVTDAPKANNLDMGNEGMSIAIGNIFGDMAPKKMKNKNSQGQGCQEDPAEKKKRRI